MNQTDQLPKLKPAIWEENRVTGILHWEAEPGKVSHCLMRWVKINTRELLVFSKLRSAERLPSFLLCLSPAANAALAILGERIQRPEILQLWTHVGEFSTYDTLWSYPDENWNYVHWNWNGQALYEKGDYSEYSAGITGEVPAEITSFELQPVESVLTQLEW